MPSSKTPTMGGCMSSDNSPSKGTKEETLVSKKIDDALRREKKDVELEVKLLLLGEYFYFYYKKIITLERETLFL